MNEIGTQYRLKDMLPNQAGIYALHDADGKIIYVGQSMCIRSRIKGHRTAKFKQFASYSFACFNLYLERMNCLDGILYLKWVEAWEIARADPIENAQFPDITLIEIRMRPALLSFARRVANGHKPTEEDYALLSAKSDQGALPLAASSSSCCVASL